MAHVPPAFQRAALGVGVEVYAPYVLVSSGIAAGQRTEERQLPSSPACCLDVFLEVDH